MIQFLDGTRDITTALTGHYDSFLVINSYLVAVLAAYAGLLMSDRIANAETARGRWAWLATGAVTMGIGVWAMHFIGMLGFVLPVPVTYNPRVTLVSSVPAMLACGVAMRVLVRARRLQGHVGWGHTLFAGVMIGGGIGLMHFTGMAAMRMDAVMFYDPALFTLSIAIAVVFGMAALYAGSFTQWLRMPLPDGSQHVISAALIGLAITGMHYTAMGATYFFPFDHPHSGQLAALSRFWMSVGVSAGTLVIILLAIAAVIVDKRLKSAAELLHVSRQRMEEAVESISDGFILFDAGGKMTMCNKVFRDMYPKLSKVLQPHTSYAEVLQSWAGLKRDDDSSHDAEDYVKECLRSFECGTAGGENREEDHLEDGRWVYIRQQTIKSGGVVGVWADVTPIKELQNLYEERAHHDPLTGLPNRDLFDDRLNHAFNHAKRQNTTLALLYMDLDRFKSINDTLGHAAGDEVLKEVGRRLQAVVRSSDTVARFGGDEFAIILEPEGDRENAAVIANRILQSLSKPIHIGSEECSVGVSIGIAVSTAQDFNDVEFIKNADAAMYEAKNASGNSYVIHGT